MRKIGFSHGTIYKIIEKYQPSSIKIFKESGSNAIEICLYNASEVEQLANIKEEVLDFSYKSIHLPTQNIVYKNDIQTLELLDKIEKFYNEINASLVLVHPDLVEDWNVFDNYKINWAIENMDNRKNKYKTMEELKEFFSKNINWKLVIDLNHCYSNDKTMNIAEDIISLFNDKIAEIHLSGYIELHEPLFITKQDFIIDLCDKINVPIIIESIFDNIDDVKKEYEYINKKLN